MFKIYFPEGFFYLGFYYLLVYFYFAFCIIDHSRGQFPSYAYLGLKLSVKKLIS